MGAPASYKLSSASMCPACNRHFNSFGARQRHLVTEHFQYGDLAGVRKNTPTKYREENQLISPE